MEPILLGEAPGDPPGDEQATGVLKRCHCYLCARDVLAVEYVDQEVQCPFCSGTAVEILETPTPPTAPTSQAAPTLQQAPSDPTRHNGVICDGCQERDFVGVRYRCLVCPDFDLCDACYAQRASIHPSHPFEAIRQPRSTQQQALNPGFSNINPWSLGRAVVTVLEVNVDDDSEAHSGLDEQEVAWWLAEDGRLADVKRVLEHDPDWMCPICSEGVEAEDSNGWLVRICGGAGPADGQDHVYHEACLRRWLLTKNQCPVCRRAPVIPRLGTTAPSAAA